ncbi:hypothetical protein YW7DRAFT_02675 [Streptomyces sp. AmelKG-E11A]|nr:hypothetical protein YW7DRAFT_02675 [Streptomyces sp. AmelKG-E11A]
MPWSVHEAAQDAIGVPPWRGTPIACERQTVGEAEKG